MRVNIRSGFNMNLPGGPAGSFKKSVAISDGLDSARESPPQKISGKKLSSSLNVRWEYAGLGNEKEPIYFVPPNTIYCNTSNDLYRFALAKIDTMAQHG